MNLTAKEAIRYMEMLDTGFCNGLVYNPRMGSFNPLLPSGHVVENIHIYASPDILTTIGAA